MILNLARQEPGDEEYGLLIEVTGISAGKFQYELAFSPIADARDRFVLERHGDLGVMFPASDIEKLQGASLTLTDQGLAMENPNSPATPAIGAATGDLTGPLADQILQVLSEQVNPSRYIASTSAKLPIL